MAGLSGLRREGWWGWEAPAPFPGCPGFPPQAGVGDAPAGDAGPPLRHTVFRGPRRALHVRAHPQGPHLVLLG